MTAAPRERATAGRSCPRDYYYEPFALNRAPDFSADVLYVVGGLYGNVEAFDEIAAMAAAETSPVTLVFNGDFHWFDADANWFSEIEQRVGPHRALRDNVEVEIARDQDIGAGCGCAYPESVDDGTVQRSNETLLELRRTASRSPQSLIRLRALPMHLVAGVGGQRVGIVHGDAGALAGWRFADGALDDAQNRGWLDYVRAQSSIGVFASTHTCLAALRTLSLPSGNLTVINNGAAGMPNFSGTQHGVVSRIATTPSPHAPLYGNISSGLHIDALPVRYDTAKFARRFLTRWPEGSPAYQSYYSRIQSGPAYAVAQAKPHGMTVAA